MAKKSTTPEESSDITLVTAAKEIGGAAGKVASLAGVKAEKPPSPPKVVIPKLAPKNKSRLPRKQKKALKKAGR